MPVDNASESLQVVVFDEDTRYDDEVGRVNIAISKLSTGDERAFDITYNDKVSGQIFLKGVWRPGAKIV